MDNQPNVTRRKPSGFRPLHSFRLRTMFVGVTLAAVIFGAKHNYDAWQLRRIIETLSKRIPPRSMADLKENFIDSHRVP